MLRDIAAAGWRRRVRGLRGRSGFSAPEAVHGVPVRRDVAAVLQGNTTLRVVVALGNPAAREAAAGRIASAVGPRFATLLHPAVWLGAAVEVGAGSMLFGHSSVTTDVPDRPTCAGQPGL